MVLVRFEARKLVELSGLPEEKLISVPWLLGGEARKENGDIIMEFNPDRPDLYSIQGVTRAIRTFEGLEHFSRIAISNEDFFVKSEPPKYRPFFTVGIVRGVRVRGLLPEIIDFQEKLHLTIGRNRKLSSIGLHDLKKVKFPITYKEVDRDQMFIPLGESSQARISEFMKYSKKAIEYGNLVGDNIPALIDSEGQIFSLPPILNSSLTTVTDDTEDILVDVEGTSPGAVEKTILLMLTALSYPSGSISTLKLNDSIAPKIEHQQVNISKNSIKRMLGYNLSDEEIKTSLDKMGYGTDGLKVTIPPYRTDVLGEVDILEDVFKGLGYNNIKRKREEFLSYGRSNPLRAFETKLRGLLVGYNLTETVSSVLVNSRLIESYGINDEMIEILNPVSQEQDSVRTRISPSLMQTFANNFRNPYPQRIFEIGSVYREGKERDILGIAIADRTASFSEIKGVFVGLLEDLGIGKYDIVRTEEAMYVPGRVAGIEANGKRLGFFGEVHPKILKNIGIKMPVAMGELDIQEVML